MSEYLFTDPSLTEYETKVANAMLHYIIDKTPEMQAFITFGGCITHIDEIEHSSGKGFKFYFDKGNLKQVDKDFKPKDYDEDQNHAYPIFKYKHFGFSFTDSEMRFDYVMGPLFARWFKYDFHLDENERIVLENENLIMMS